MGSRAGSTTALERWTAEALAQKDAHRPTRVPLPLLFEEAAGVARFFEDHWAGGQGDDGGPLRGLQTAAAPGSGLSAETGREIVDLVAAAQAAQAAYGSALRAKGADVVGRAKWVLGEIRATLRYLAGTGQARGLAAVVKRLDGEYPGEPGSVPVLAGALDTWATVAAQHRKKLAGLGGFDAALLDEAPKLARAVREKPTGPARAGSAAKAALRLRNGVLALLCARMKAVRSAALFVYRDRPEIAQQATSSYERRKGKAKRARKAGAGEKAKREQPK